MPTVPRIRSQVLPSVQPAIQAPRAAFGVESTLDLSGPQQLLQRASNDADQMLLNSKELELANAQTQYMTQATSARGINALDAATDAKAKWQQAADEIVSSVGRPHVQQALRQRANGYSAHLHEAVESHAAAEASKADADTTDALLKKGKAMVEADPSLGGVYADINAAKIAEYGQRRGWSPEQIQQTTAEHVSDIHASAIAGLLSSDQFEQASKYYDEHGSQLVGKQKAVLAKAVEKGRDQYAAERQADAIIKAHASASDALAAAEAIQDYGQRDIAVKAVERHFTQKATAEHIDRSNAQARVLKRLDGSGGRLNQADPDWQTIAGHPEGEHVLERQRQLLHPPKDPGDPEAFLSHMNMASLSPASRAEFVRMDFSGKDGAGLNVSQKTRLIQLQRQYRGQDARGSETDQVQAEQLRFQREGALLKVGDPNSSGYIEDKATRDAEVSRIKAHYDALAKARGLAPHPVAAAASSGNVNLGHAPAIPLAPAVEPIQATPQMIAGAARNPAYAEYLRNMGVVLPKKLPLPVAEKPKP